MRRLRIGISSCLLGNPVRWDGGHRLDRILMEALGKYAEWVAVCPEVESGLSVPRPAMQLTGDPNAPRLVTIETGIDYTDRLKDWAVKKIFELKQLGICGFVFKSRSPSCGIKGIEIYSENGTATVYGQGIFARMLIDGIAHLPVEDEEGLHDHMMREGFIESAYSFCGIKKRPV